MRPRIFIFCSYLHKKLCDDVLAPSEPFSDPLWPSAGPKIENISENSTIQAVIPRGTDRRSACLSFKFFHIFFSLAGWVLWPLQSIGPGFYSYTSSHYFKAETLYNMSFDLNQKKQVFEDNKAPKNRFLTTIKNPKSFLLRP